MFNKASRDLKDFKTKTWQLLWRTETSAGVPKCDLLCVPGAKCASVGADVVEGGLS